MNNKQNILKVINTSKPSQEKSKEQIEKEEL